MLLFLKIDSNMYKLINYLNIGSSFKYLQIMRVDETPASLNSILIMTVKLYLRAA